MKKLIRYLANITGVTYEIQSETFTHIGARLMGNSFWFNKKPECKELIYRYGEHMYTYHNMPDVSRVRDELVKEN